MSILTTFFAVPSDVALETLVGPRDCINEELQYLGRFFQSPFKHGLEKASASLWLDCLNRHPELPSLQLDLGKQSNRFHFLLCACARGQEPDETDSLFHDALVGCQISKNVIASQGVPLAYLPAPLVLRIAQALVPMNHAAFGRHYGADGGEVYFGDRIAEPYEQSTWLHEWFDDFKTFFVDTAQYGHAVFRVED